MRTEPGPQPRVLSRDHSNIAETSGLLPGGLQWEEGGKRLVKAEWGLLMRLVWSLRHKI